MKKQLSIIIPVYNEEKTINQVIDDLKKELFRLDLDFEIIVVNDASTDKSKEIIEKISEIKIFHHPINKGYGASLKTGIKNAKFDYLLFLDADNQFPIEKIEEFLKYVPGFDMISGARIRGYKGPLTRLPGKKILNLIANYLTKTKIPDLNCGFRIVNKKEISKFLHLLPQGYSLSTTSLLTFIKSGLNVKFVPIEIKKRTDGKSMVKPKDAFRTFLLIARIVLLFSPFKIFLPINVIIFLLAIGSGTYDIFFRPHNITDATILLLVSSILMFFFSLVADQLAAIRREINHD
jgi:glycosyltransferase involved in cell wall biosynthesis